MGFFKGPTGPAAILLLSTLMISSTHVTNGQAFGGSGGSSTSSNNMYATSTPNQVWDCYLNWELRDRFLRLPQSMDNLIGIIRKIENSRQAYSWDVEKLSSVILQRFRSDGIFFRPPDNRNPTADMVNLFEGIREEQLKLSIMHKLAPDHSATEFPEDILTPEEKCGLHFMLSYSLNDTYRPDENNRGSTTGGSNWSGRRKRAISDWDEKDDDVEEEEPEEEEEEPEEEEDVPEQEPPAASPVQARPSGGSLRDDSENLVGKRSGLQSMAQSQSQSQSQPKQQNSKYTTSQYPLEYGVVYTRYGTVAAGAVLAGISYGLQERGLTVERILPDNMNAYGIPAEMLNAQITNYYAGTLPGDIAQSAVHKAGNANDAIIGPGGRWNDTVLPTEYSLDYDRTRVSFLTHAEILGGIDGLIMARKMKDWDQSYVKLSHILEMYYSDRGVSIGRTTQSSTTDPAAPSKKFRACDRFALIQDDNLIRRQEFDDQARAFAYAVYLSNSPVVAPQIQTTVNDQVSKVLSQFWSFVSREGDGMKNEWECPMEYTGSMTGSNRYKNIPVETRIDLHVMIDSDSDSADIYGSIYAISQALARLQVDAVGTNRVGINMTLGDTWQCFLNLGEETNKAMVAHQMLRTRQWGYSGRLDIEKALQTIHQEYKQLTDREYGENRGGSNAKVFLLVIPRGRPQGTERDLEEMFEAFYRDHPDIEVIFMVGSTEWKKYTKGDKNFINLKQFDVGTKLHDRLKEIPARLTYPKCRDNNRDYELGNKYEGYYTPGTRQLMAYNAHYLFSSDKTVIKVKFSQKLPIEVCSQRRLDRDDGIKCGRVMDSSDNSVEFNHWPKCGWNCDPVYITMNLVQDADSTPYSPACSDPRVCAFPDQVKFEVTHDWMRCNSGAALTINLAIISAALAWIFAWRANAH